MLNLSNKLINKKFIFLLLGILLVLPFLPPIVKKIHYRYIVTDCYNKVTKSEINKCVQNIALEKDIIGLCEYIKDTKEKDIEETKPFTNTYFYSKNSCYLKMAEKRQDANICNKIDDKRKEICKNKVSDLNTQ